MFHVFGKTVFHSSDILLSREDNGFMLHLPIMPFLYNTTSTTTTMSKSRPDIAPAMMGTLPPVSSVGIVRSKIQTAFTLVLCSVDFQHCFYLLGSENVDVR